MLPSIFKCYITHIPILYDENRYFQNFQNIVDTSFVSSKSNKGIWEFAAKLVETVTTKNLAGNSVLIYYLRLTLRYI